MKASASVSEYALLGEHHHRFGAMERVKSVTKKKKVFCGEVCALEFARVGEARKMVVVHRVVGNLM